MYESTRDQIKYERRSGLDSHLIDAVRPNGDGQVDRWLETLNWRKALDADVWVVHSGLPPPLQDYIQLPENRKKHIIVTIMHGPCENMLIKEWAQIMSDSKDERAFTITHINAIWFHDACVVLNKHEYDISTLFDEYDKLIYIPNSIDLERYPHDGLTWEFKNRPAVVSFDVPRYEKLPVHILFAMSKIADRIPTARLNMFGIPFENVEFFRNMICRAKERIFDFHLLEELQLRSFDLKPYMRGADIGFNSNYSGIASRVHMEMMAMGTPIVSYNGDYTKYHAKCFDLNSIAEQVERCWNDLNDPSMDLKNKTIEYAHENFDRSKHVKEYVKLYEKLKEEK
jgi:glycosyltransferase involved in cell wall biosynthesis